MNKIVWLFMGSRYYPEGGALDYKMRGTEEECKEHFKEACRNTGLHSSWAQIVDPESFKVIQFGFQDDDEYPRWGPDRDETFDRC